MALSIAGLAGEVVWGLTNTVIRLGDGSWIAVQTDAPSYTAGQILTGKVVASIVNPVVCDDVSVLIELEEAVYWDEERSHTVTEGEPPHQRTRTVWHHDARQFRTALFREVIRVAALTAVLPPGMWQWPFSYAIPPSVPGVMKFRKFDDFSDPSWRSHGRKKETRAEVSFLLKAQLQCRGVFSNDLRSSQELVVNPLFDWARMQPQTSSKAGQVLVCCCIPRGTVVLNVAADKAAYQMDEVMRITAVIENNSSSAVRRMVSKLKRVVILRDGAGHSRRLEDVICSASYEGVAPKSSGTRDMPLTLTSPTGFLPSIAAPHVTVSYYFSCECDIAFAFDIVAQMPITIYTPAPPTGSFAAAFGGQVPAGFA